VTNPSASHLAVHDPTTVVHPSCAQVTGPIGGTSTMAGDSLAADHTRRTRATACSDVRLGWFEDHQAVRCRAVLANALCADSGKTRVRNTSTRGPASTASSHASEDLFVWLRGASGTKAQISSSRSTVRSAPRLSKPSHELSSSSTTTRSDTPSSCHERTAS